MACSTGLHAGQIPLKYIHPALRKLATKVQSKNVGNVLQILYHSIGLDKQDGIT